MSTNPATADRPAEEPWPPRFWWLRRITTASLVFLVLATTFIVTWYFWQRHRFDALRADLRARREPAVAADLNHPSIRPSEDAAIHLTSAAAGLTFSQSEDTLVDEFSVRPPTTQTIDAMAAIVNRYAAPLASVRAARNLSRADWGIRYSSPLHAVLLRHLNPQRYLVSFLESVALYQHFHGDDAGCLETVHDIDRNAIRIGADPLLITFIIAIGYDTSACDVIQTTIAQMNLSSPAAQNAARQLIAALLDEAPIADMHTRAMQYETVMAMDSAEYVTQHALALAPLFLDQAIFAAAEYQATRRRIDASDYAAVQHALSNRIKPPWSPKIFTTLSPALRSQVFSGQTYTEIFYFQWLMRRRLTAAALAIRLYQSDHTGQLPSSLNALVPSYLPSVPVDFFDPHAAPIRYLRDAKFPAVYSVGHDGIDDAANHGQPPTKYNYDLWTSPDAAIYLAPRPIAEE